MPRADRIPFLTGRTLVTVLATLNEREVVSLVVDSGAERMVISRMVAARLGLDLCSPLRLQPLAGVGQSPPMPVVRLERVRVGASSVGGLETSILDLPGIIRADGLLGLNFLRRFRVTFDFEARVLILRESPAR